MLQNLLQTWRRRRRPVFFALPIGRDGEVPWHSTPSQTRRILAQHKAASSDVGGYPTARIRRGDTTLRATLEYAQGICLSPKVWLAAVPGALYARRDGTRVTLDEQLRAANLQFEDLDPRGNWRWVLDWLGKPDERADDGAWEWRWEDMTARYYERRPGEESPAWMRFAPRAKARSLEIVNQSSLELYSQVAVRVDFKQGTWHMGDRPALSGVTTRLHWDTPPNEVLLVTATVDGLESSIEVGRRARQVVITNDAAGGVRLVV